MWLPLSEGEPNGSPPDAGIDGSVGFTVDPA
jgi:hypothetical protein